MKNIWWNQIQTYNIYKWVELPIENDGGTRLILDISQDKEDLMTLEKLAKIVEDGFTKINLRLDEHEVILKKHETILEKYGDFSSVII